jgi:hypothetical protein
LTILAQPGRYGNSFTEKNFDGFRATNVIRPKLRFMFLTMLTLRARLAPTLGHGASSWGGMNDKMANSFGGSTGFWSMSPASFICSSSIVRKL